MKASPHRATSPSGHISKSIIIGTAGHIDHGKTALIYALTGTNTDRLPEEKRRGITIDLGFAAMLVPNANGGLLQLSFIDVPGHHAFVRNMLAGTGSIDCALLVIAADEGVKAQTEEHLAICSLLGIEHGFVVLTKKDAVSQNRLRETMQSTQTFLQNSFLERAAVLAVSAKTGEGIAELRSALAQMAAAIPARDQTFVPRLSSDRAFSIRGFGTVVTGTLRSGEIRVCSALSLEPGGRAVRVRGIQVHGASVNSVCAPARAALNLTGIGPREVQRGKTLVPAGTLLPTSIVDAEISLLPHAPALKHRASVRFHAFTGDISATVLLYAIESVNNQVPALVRRQLEHPQVLIPGDRFVLRIPSPAVTIGGGRVLDAVARRGTRKAEALHWLEQLRDADVEKQLELRIERRAASGAQIYDLVKETGLTPDAIRQTLKPLIEQSAIIAKSDGNAPITFAISAKALAALQATILAHVAHAKNSSISRAELRSCTGLNETVFGLALERLESAGKIEGGDTLSLADRAATVDDQLQKRASAIEREYAAAGIAPPLLREVSDRLQLHPAQLREAITVLLRSRRLYRLGPDDLFIHCDAVAKLSATLLTHRGEAFDVGRFKSLTGLTRKHAIPLLEYLDRAHITRNVAGTRFVL